MLESIIEKFCTKYAVKSGWLAMKATGKRGKSDHIYHKNSFTFYIEYKATGKKATPQQKKRAKELQSSGIVSRCYDDIQNAQIFIDEISYMTSLPFNQAIIAYRKLLSDLSSFNKKD